MGNMGGVEGGWRMFHWEWKKGSEKAKEEKEKYREKMERKKKKEGKERDKEKDAYIRVFLRTPWLWSLLPPPPSTLSSTANFAFCNQWQEVINAKFLQIVWEWTR